MQIIFQPVLQSRALLCFVARFLHGLLSSSSFDSKILLLRFLVVSPPSVSVSRADVSSARRSFVRASLNVSAKPNSNNYRAVVTEMHKTVSH